MTCAGIARNKPKNAATTDIKWQPISWGTSTFSFRKEPWSQLEALVTFHCDGWLKNSKMIFNKASHKSIAGKCGAPEEMEFPGFGHCFAPAYFNLKRWLNAKHRRVLVTIAFPRDTPSNARSSDLWQHTLREKIGWRSMLNFVTNKANAEGEQLTQSLWPICTPCLKVSLQILSYHCPSISSLNHDAIEQSRHTVSGRLGITIIPVDLSILH